MEQLIPRLHWWFSQNLQPATSSIHIDRRITLCPDGGWYNCRVIWWQTMWSPYWVLIVDQFVSEVETSRTEEDHHGAGIHAAAARGAAAVGTAVVPWGPINLAHCSLRLRGQHLRLARYTLFMAARSALPARILSVVSWAIWSVYSQSRPIITTTVWPTSAGAIDCCRRGGDGFQIHSVIS